MNPNLITALVNIMIIISFLFVVFALNEWRLEIEAMNQKIDDLGCVAVCRACARLPFFDTTTVHQNFTSQINSNYDNAEDHATYKVA